MYVNNNAVRLGRLRRLAQAVQPQLISQGSPGPSIHVTGYRKKIFYWVCFRGN